MSKVTEAVIQGVLMRRLMAEWHHVMVLPNSNTFFYWEADVISITRAGLAHEFEIKLCQSDYKRDHKKFKHQMLSFGPGVKTPSYFWYVTHALEIEVPEYAGWINVYLERGRWITDIKKAAPRLHKLKVSVDRQLVLARLLSWRVADEYLNKVGI